MLEYCSEHQHSSTSILHYSNQILISRLFLLYDDVAIFIHGRFLLGMNHRGGIELLEQGHKISGPAIIEQLDTTTVIQPEQQATVDEYRNIIIKEKKA